jgi:hypothetical protein
MENFNLKKFLVENKLTYNSKLLAEAVEVPEWLKGKLADVHSKPGQGSIFAKPIDTVMKTVQQVVDGAKNVDQVANSTGTLTVSSPGIGYNLVLPMAQALKLPGAKQGEVEKVEGPNKVKVPSVTTTAPLSQFASNELTVIVRPKKDEAGAVIPNEYIVLSAFPGDPDIPRASEWGDKFAVIIPGGEQGVNEGMQYFHNGAEMNQIINYDDSDIADELEALGQGSMDGQDFRSGQVYNIGGQDYKVEPQGDEFKLVIV